MTDDGDSPPVFCIPESDLTSSYGCSERLTNLKFNPLSDEMSQLAQDQTSKIMDRILKCKPNEHREILQFAQKPNHRFLQEILDCRYLLLAIHVSPFLNPSNDGSTFERQKKTFNGELNASVTQCLSK